MEKVKTPGKKAATRARLMEGRAKRAAEREKRERANITDLTEYFVQVERHDAVDGWLRAQIEKVKTEAQNRRLRHRVAAGVALQSMQDRGETLSSIAEQTEIGMAKVRTYLGAAADAAGTLPKAGTIKAEPKDAGPATGGTTAETSAP